MTFFTRHAYSGFITATRRSKATVCQYCVICTTTRTRMHLTDAVTRCIGVWCSSSPTCAPRNETERSSDYFALQGDLTVSFGCLGSQTTNSLQAGDYGSDMRSTVKANHP